MNNTTPIFNTIAQSRGGNEPRKPWFSVQAMGDEHTILIHDQIGKDWWTDDGIASKEFALEFGKIPAGRKIKMRINSPGGSVHDGLAIYNIVAERRKDVTVVVDGCAASIASVIALAGSKTIMPKNALMMIHNPWSRVTGDEHAMRKAADMLRIHGDAIANVYVERTKRTKDELLELMNAETWMTGETAVSMGFATESTNDDVSASISPSILNAAPEAIRNSVQQASRAQSVSGKSNDQLMNREQILALLKRHGISVDAKATDADLQALLDTALARATTPAASVTTPQAAAQPAPAPAAATDPTIVQMQAQLDGLRRERDTERANRIGRDVDALIAENRIPANSREDWVRRAAADETVLNALRALPQNIPGTSPVHSVRITAEDPTIICKELAQIRSRVSASDRFNPHTARINGTAFANEYRRNRDRIFPLIQNTNTIATELKRQVIFQEAIEGFAIALLPLNAFSTVLGGVTLEGTNKVNVPFIDLVGVASVAFNGTYAMADTATASREVNIDQRLVQAFSYTSDELRRQPALNILTHIKKRVERLGYDVVQSVLGKVTAANFGAASFTGAAAGFDSDDIADLAGVCSTANWGNMRSLILSVTYHTALLKDTSIKSALAYGGVEGVRDGRPPRVNGFDIYEANFVPANGENLVGMAANPAGLLFANAPITPTPDVLKNLSQYEAIVDPATGATFEFRRWGSPDTDNTKQVIECNFGSAKGNEAAIKRLVSA